MTREFTNGHPQRLPACNFLLQYCFYSIFLQNSHRFSLQTLAKFEATKTGSDVGFLRLTAVWVYARIYKKYYFLGSIFFFKGDFQYMSGSVFDGILLFFRFGKFKKHLK